MIATYLRPKYLLFAIVGFMMLLVMYSNERFLINMNDPKWLHYASFKWWLLPHGVAGALALFLGPLQFSDRLRNRFRKWHRVAGRIYVAGALLAATLGIYIQQRLGPPPLITVIRADGALLIFTTSMGLWMAMSGNIQAHKQWMTRSYAVAIVFLEVRCIAAIPFLNNMVADNSVADIWSCLVLSVVLADTILQLEPMLKRRRQPSAKHATA